ncbi:MAG: Tfp pilus assembly protein PilN [Rhodoferax sp.]|jgi:Tfp pilus assembly protein PilN
MPQQINLCPVMPSRQKDYFSASSLLQMLAIFAVAGGGFCVYWVWSINTANHAMVKTLASEALELQTLQARLARESASSGPLKATLALDLQSRQAELLRREALLQELQSGLSLPGWGHAARLQLVAQSIPSQVWVTRVNANEFQLEVTGFTLDPAALNEWVAKLALSPLLKGQQLATLKVEQAMLAAPKAGESLTTVRPRWSFSLVSALGEPTAMARSQP